MVWGRVMKRTVWLWQLFGFAAVSLLGTLLHFLYEWSGGAIWLAPFCGVNESTAEHMKLLFWPMLAFAVFERRFFKDRRDFWCIKLSGIAFGLFLIPFLFYGYNGVIGKSPDWVNITIFFVSAALAYIYESEKFRKSSTPCKNPQLALLTMIVIAVLFTLFTFAPPPIAIFRDPLTGGYGIP